MDNNGLHISAQEEIQHLRLHDPILREDFAESLQNLRRQVSEVVDVARMLSDLFHTQLLQRFGSMLNLAIKTVRLNLPSLPSSRTFSFWFCLWFRILRQLFAARSAKQSTVRPSLAIRSNSKALGADLTVL